MSIGVPALRSTDFINTIPPEREPWFPGDEHIERRIRAYVRWNAAIMVSRANREGLGVGGHIATYASAASLYEVGFNHFFRGKDHGESGDQVFFQGHASPGIYARAYLEGRLTERQLDGFRQEISAARAAVLPAPAADARLLGVPHRLHGARADQRDLPGPFQPLPAQPRDLKDTSRSRVWAFLGDGEMDEPEALGAIGVAAREELDNLIFVVNCNLQRLDGPVRGNGKIMQELESYFLGAGWNVIKVVWGRDWDPLLAQDVDGVLVNQMNTTPDGQFQTYSTSRPATTSASTSSAATRGCAGWSRACPTTTCGASRAVATTTASCTRRTSRRPSHEGQPTVILTHTIKGWTLGADFEARNATHQMKKLTKAELKDFRDRLYLPIRDADLEGDIPPYYHPGPDSDEIEYMRERRAALGGSLPSRVVRTKPLKQPPAEDVRRPQGRIGQAGRRHHDGVRAPAQGADEGLRAGQALRADHPGRGPHVRHGLAVPDREDLLAVRPAVRGRRP